MEKTLVCIACPRGCRLTVTKNELSDTVEVQGNGCPKGIAYGKQELLCPMRTVTTTVACRAAQKCNNTITTPVLMRLPVKTGCEIPLADIMTAVRAIHDLVIDAPVFHGDCIARIDGGKGAVIPVIACASTED